MCLWRKTYLEFLFRGILCLFGWLLNAFHYITVWCIKQNRLIDCQQNLMSGIVWVGLSSSDDLITLCTCPVSIYKLAGYHIYNLVKKNVNLICWPMNHHKAKPKQSSYPQAPKWHGRSGMRTTPSMLWGHGPGSSVMVTMALSPRITHHRPISKLRPW